MGDRGGPFDRLPLLVLDQKILDWLIIFLGEVETAIRPGIRVRFGIMGFEHE